MKSTKLHRGYAALISILVISSVLIVLVLQGAREIISLRLTLFEAELHTQAKAQAIACAELVQRKLKIIPSYRPAPSGDVLTLDRDLTCSVLSVELHGDSYTVATQGRSESVVVERQFTFHK
ncbi:MAG: hypothetical protein JWN64_101 [Parcubacteria group bacterium]|nr:hypothetical protein [Parcubacteria group bacterium]